MSWLDEKIWANSFYEPYHFIYLTEQDYIDYCVERAKERAIEEANDVLKHYLKPFENVKEYFRPNNNTIEEFEELLHEMGDTEGLGETRKQECLKLMKDDE